MRTKKARERTVMGSCSTLVAGDEKVGISGDKQDNRKKLVLLFFLCCSAF
jgi:hypothetical protein